ncbi:hypothetical protein Y10_14920 [Neptunitalea sp. Y10]|uniref:Uncharacterized protein n=1 Tax=Neptunitalea lumnitzerae TaxID=2965509 RepID=A0ABQ5MIB1_9FLAO|nr:hypothetical protein Y10_14920 [Neptunitalea sp. Y10]
MLLLLSIKLSGLHALEHIYETNDDTDDIECALCDFVLQDQKAPVLNISNAVVHTNKAVPTWVKKSPQTNYQSTLVTKFFKLHYFSLPPPHTA